MKKLAIYIIISILILSDEDFNVGVSINTIKKENVDKYHKYIGNVTDFFDRMSNFIKGKGFKLDNYTGLNGSGKYRYINNYPAKDKSYNILLLEKNDELEYFLTRETDLPLYEKNVDIKWEEIYIEKKYLSEKFKDIKDEKYEINKTYTEIEDIITEKLNIEDEEKLGEYDVDVLGKEKTIFDDINETAKIIEDMEVNGIDGFEEYENNNKKNTNISKRDEKFYISEYYFDEIKEEMLEYKRLNETDYFYIKLATKVESED